MLFIQIDPDFIKQSAIFFNYQKKYSRTRVIKQTLKDIPYGKTCSFRRFIII